MKTPRVHAELIKAWADGAEIEVYSLDREWVSLTGYVPSWNKYSKYRIKPEPKPDAIRYADVTGLTMHLYSNVKDGASNLKLTFDGETGKLKSAEVLV